MLHIERLELNKSAEIPASASAVWSLLTDWAGMLRWSRSAKRPGPAGLLVKCELIGETGKVPRTRRMILDSGAAVEEELFYQNDSTRRIYYRKTDSSGTIGYIASCYVDAIDEKRCTLHIQSWFDFAGDASAGRARYEAIYDGIFEGFTACLSVST